MKELDRILQLPITSYRRAGWGEVLRLHENAPRLFDDQEVFLDACAHAADTWFDDTQGGPGVLGLMSCGAGKTLSLQLAPRVFGIPADQTLLITEAGLLPQLRNDVLEWGRHYPVANPQAISYGKLSHPAYKYVLHETSPKLILCDEFQNLAGTGARAKRMFEYLNEHPEVRLVGLTGTLVKRQLRQFYAAAAIVLRHWLPLPYNNILSNWASVMDVGGEPSEYDFGTVRRLVQWAGYDGRSITKQTARRAWQRRLQTNPGIVVTSGPLNVEVSLRIRMMELPATPEFERLENLWELPDGTMLVDTLEVARHRRTMRLGFFYRWDPETFDPEYDELRKKWGKVLRDHVEYAGFDSPFFVEHAAEAGTLRRGALKIWEAWKDIRTKVSPPETEAVWFDDKAIPALLDWFEGECDDAAPIVWAKSRAVLDRLEELGWPVYRAGEGTPLGGRAAISLAYSKGWNGHGYRSALVLEPPAGADRMEQLLARHHRKKQTSDVNFWLVGSDLDRMNVTANSRAVSDLTGTPQRFLLADWPVRTT